MGQQHNELRRGALSAAFTRAVGDMRGSGGIERYGETLTPVLDLWSLPEWLFLRGERGYAFPVVGPAVAAEFGAAAVVNPAGSGFLLVVEKLTVDAGAFAGSSVLNVEVNTEAIIAATLGTVSGFNVLDTRWFAATGTFGAGVARVGSDPGVIGLPLESARVPAGNMPESKVALPYTLHPGFGLVARFGTVNTAFLANFRVRERRAFPSELP